MYFATAPVTVTMNLDGEAYPATVTQTWPAAGSLFVPAKIALKMPPNKFKTCSWQIQSSAPFYLFDCLRMGRSMGAVGRLLAFQPVQRCEKPKRLGGVMATKQIQYTPPVIESKADPDSGAAVADIAPTDIRPAGQSFHRDW